MLTLTGSALLSGAALRPVYPRPGVGCRPCVVPFTIYMMPLFTCLYIYIYWFAYIHVGGKTESQEREYSYATEFYFTYTYNFLINLQLYILKVFSSRTRCMYSEMFIYIYTRKLKQFVVKSKNSSTNKELRINILSLLVNVMESGVKSTKNSLTSHSYYVYMIFYIERLLAYCLTNYSSIHKTRVRISWGKENFLSQLTGSGCDRYLTCIYL